MNNKAMYKLSYGLFVLTTRNDGKDYGCIINTAIQAASEPNQISICVNKANYTHDMIKSSGIFTVSVISEEADISLFKHFGFQSGKNVDKFADFTYAAECAEGMKYITKGTNAYMCVKVTQTTDL